MLPMDMDFDDEYSDEEYGEEMFEDEMAAAAMSRPQEKVVNMNVASGMSLPPFETVLLTSRRLRNRSQDSRRYSGSYSQYPSSSYWICGSPSRGSYCHAQSFWGSHSSNSFVCWSRQDCSY
jgi:hypothetical protein